MKHDRLVLALLWRELHASLRSMRRDDLFWIGIGGAALLAYAGADFVFALRAHAATLRQSPWLWPAGLPAAATALGLCTGHSVTCAALSRAYSPFLRVLPLSHPKRRRMAVFATVAVGAVLTVVVALVAGVASTVVARSHPFVWSAVIAALFATGLAVAMVVRLRGLPLADADQTNTAAARRRKIGRSASMLRHADRARPAWLGAWAWNLPAGQVIPSWRVTTATMALGLAAAVSITTILVQHQVALGAITGLVGGLLVFMLSLRCHPLGSPVLRTAPIGFAYAWLRLLWLPFILSTTFFLLPAGAALAAEPSSWTISAASGLWLLVLNGIYAVFAAYFLNAPLVATISFLAAIAYTFYESLEYSRTVVIGLAALVLWLGYRTRQRYYYG